MRGTGAIIQFIAAGLYLVQLAGAAVAGPTAQRIVTLSPALAEMVVDVLGDAEAQSRLVGVTEYSDVPHWISERIRTQKLREIGSYVQFSLEAVQALKPDLILATHDGNPADRIERLQKTGRRVWVTSVNRLTEISDLYAKLGSELGAPARGIALKRECDQLIEAIRARRPAKRPKVFLQLGLDPLVTATRATFLGEAMEWLGADLLFSDLAERYPRVSKEAVIGARPEALWMMELTGSKDLEKQVRATWKGIAGMEKLPIRLFEASAFSRPTLRLLRALRHEAGGP